jgi:hypothetical protein
MCGHVIVSTAECTAPCPADCIHNSNYKEDRPITLSQAKQVLAEAGFDCVPKTIELKNGLIGVRTGGMGVSAEYVIKSAQDKPDA